MSKATARRPGLLRHAVMVAAAIALAATLLSACGGASSVSTFSQTPTTVKGVTLSTEESPVGRILTTGSGYTLYDFTLDTPNKSACTSSECVFLWPPLVTTTPTTVGKGLHQSLVGVVQRSDGSMQVTYGGHPLYRWTSDTKPGMTTGQALLNEGGYWFVISPSGHPITTPFTVQ